MAKQNKLQVSGFATIARSNKLPTAVHQVILEGREGNRCPDGSQRAFRKILKDEEGNEVVIQGRLYKNGRGSITSRIAFKMALNPSELCWVAIPKQREESAEDEGSGFDLAEM